MVSERIERKLAAIVAADVAGYSRLMAADEEGTLARLKAHRKALIDPKIVEHSGRIIKTTGDGMLIEFASVVDAVRCVVEIQRGMLERNADIPSDKRIDFRVGINIGDVIVDGEDIYGDGVNVAARMESLAEPGGILVSGVVRDQVRDRLSFSFDDLGDRNVKNIPRPVRAYRVNLSDDGRPPAPAAKASRGLGLVGAAVLLLVVVAGVAAWYLFIANRPAAVATGAPAPVASNANAPAEAARLSIVVLPFANLSGDPAQDYLADALTDELTTGLARLRDTFVIARNTASTYKGKPVDAKAIGKDLGVRYVLEGSIQPSGDKVRVNAQLIDAQSGAHLWAEQFDIPRADLLQMQDEIVAHLARAMDIQLRYVEAARLKRTPASNPNAEDLALQCNAGVQKGGYIGKEADEGYALCEQALAADPDNARALSFLSVKFWLTAALDLSVDRKADLDRADELNSKALALDPNYAGAHAEEGNILASKGRINDAIAENERALALDPAMVDGYSNLGRDYTFLGQFEKSLEYLDKAIRLSPRDPNPGYWSGNKAEDYFALKQYDQAIEWARRSIAIGPNTPETHAVLIAALALGGHGAEAHEALQRYLALPPGVPRTIAAWQVFKASKTNGHSDPRYVESWEREIEGLRKAGMPEEAPVEAPRLSIVVLPFANLSGDPAQDYLADALADELTTGLSRIRDSFVIARNTAFTYKGKSVDAKAIGKDLGVRYVLEGSVQPSGTQVRVNAQLIDADSGAHIWADQFDTARADLLQMQDEIVTHLARAMQVQLAEAEAARLKRAPAGNPDAEDLALQCEAAEFKAGYVGKDADAGFSLCERALAVDPNNALALMMLSNKYWLPVGLGRSADPKADLERADQMVSQALALDPNFGAAHMQKGNILALEGRFNEAIAENERAIALDPSFVDADANLGFDYLFVGEFQKSLEYFDKAMTLSPHDPNPGFWTGGKAQSFFGLKQYDQAVEWARRSIAINPNIPFAQQILIAALALTGHDADAHEALQRYLALPPIGPRTIAAFRALNAHYASAQSDPRILESYDRQIEGLRKAGMPET